MNTLPDIPRLYTAFAEWLACLLYVVTMRRRFARWPTVALSAGMLAVLGAFLHVTSADRIPLAWWLPCMAAAVALMYLYIWLCCDVTPVAAGYCCAQAFILAEFAASLEWQIHCYLLLGHTGLASCLLALALLGLVYGGVYGLLCWFNLRRLRGTAPPEIGLRSLGSAAVMALTAFAVSNLRFAQNGEIDMSVYYIRTLVDLAGVLTLFNQQEQLREAALHQELAAINNVLHLQYEQYRQSKENIRLLNRSYHDLKVQIAAIRAERDPDRQAAALDQMESGIKLYESQFKTGNPVLDTVLTTKGLSCQQRGINFTCVADGRLLDFLPTMDICTIVGTALDNAIEAIRPLPKEQRLLRTAIYEKNGFVMLRFENYHGPELSLDRDGLPARGYGIKSIQATAQKYGGTVTVHDEDHWFTLRVLLPVQR